MNITKSLKVLVIGGAGYIGSHVTKALLKAEHQPVVFDNLSTGLRKNLFKEVPFIHGDILHLEDLRKAFAQDIDAVIHMAALKAAGESMFELEKYSVHNITGTLNILNSATEAKIDKIVFSSTAAVYGDPVYLPVDEKHSTKPINYYGFTKLEIESFLKWYDQIRGLKYAALRYFNAAGYDIDGELNGLEQKPNNLLPIVMEAVFGIRSHVELFGEDYDTRDGSCIRDYIHVTDLADAHVKALDYLETKKESITANLGTSNGLTVKEIFEITKRLSGIDFEIKTGPRREGDPAELLGKADYAKEKLGWEAKHSDGETLIKTMLQAYKANFS